MRGQKLASWLQVQFLRGAWYGANSGAAARSTAPMACNSMLINSNPSAYTACCSALHPRASLHTGDPQRQPDRSQADSTGTNTVFTGTADVETKKDPEEVATDSTRHWVAGDDLGTRANAALDAAEQSSSQASTGDTADPAVSAAGACHPADPYCTAGEAAPRPDDFHDEGDGSTPPSAGFPA